MKLSISLRDADLSALDHYVRAAGLPSRSAALQHAIQLLGHENLERDYEAAWEAWDASDDRLSWEHTTADGLT